ncbi:MAG TPA: hypothetical protein VE174_07915 [Actinomycetota bacterium]|nr:hypothetical protein [Actinomycetota bacterium]
MAALAYLVPPVSGLIAFLIADRGRVRFHGLQSIVIGTVWPALIYLGAFVSPSLTRIAFFGGASVWVVLLMATALGRDLALPGVRGFRQEMVPPAAEEVR